MRLTIEQLEEKLAHRPNSPLFALLANEYLAAGRVEEAKRLCIAGLESFPSYITAHWILAKCHAAAGDFHSAISSIQDVQSLGTDSPLVDNFYQQCLMHLVATPQQGFAADELSLAEPVSASEESERMITPEDVGLGATQSSATESHEETRETTAPVGISSEEFAQIQPARIDDEKRIVSRTLAEIYASQGEYGEAILTYQLLMAEQPAMSGEFEERIRELGVLLQQKMAGQKEGEPTL